MTNRLTPEALAALLAKHEEGVDGLCAGCPDWALHPCPIYLLASEVRDARPVIEVSRRQHLCIGLTNGHPICQICVGLAHYEEGTK